MKKSNEAIYLTFGEKKITISGFRLNFFNAVKLLLFFWKKQSFTFHYNEMVFEDKAKVSSTSKKDSEVSE